MISQFALRLICGMSLMWALMPRRDVTSGFFRIQMLVVMGLGVLAVLTSGMLTQTLATVIGVAGFVGSIAWTLERRVAGEWISSDRGLSEFRIVRDGCFRAAIPLPARATIKDVRAIRAEVFARPGKANGAPARLVRINTLFALDEHFVPGTPAIHWTGSTQ